MFNITKRSGGRGRRRITSLLLAAGVSMGFLLPAAPASADTASTLTVVGTSDVQDSGLIPGLITPMFEKAYPQFTLNYVSLGSGAAIAYAEAGTASALIVHAASLENQFVANGYSLEKYGRAVFWGDYVLLGPASDPAGVLSGAPHSIVQAFQDIAAAGAAGHADLVSRANTSGTAVQEHAIWALTSGTTLCTVSAANGGGDAPSTASRPTRRGTTPPDWSRARTSRRPTPATSPTPSPPATTTATSSPTGAPSSACSAQPAVAPPGRPAGRRPTCRS
jgi:hypothetical protein